MKIEHTPPPNYAEIQKYFPEADYEKGVLFTYGDTCYCKSITVDLMVHENTHTKQQTNPEEWWAKYFIDPAFRLSQEAEAYHNQYVFIDKNIKDREKKNRVLRNMASDLCGDLYGNMISHSEAMKLIKNYK